MNLRKLFAGGFLPHAEDFCAEMALLLLQPEHRTDELFAGRRLLRNDDARNGPRVGGDDFDVLAGRSTTTGTALIVAGDA